MGKRKMLSDFVINTAVLFLHGVGFMLTQLALAPAMVLIVFVMSFDKYSKEPFSMVFTAVLAGAFTVIPVMALCVIFKYTWLPYRFPVIYKAYFSSAFLEEGMKAVFLFFFTYKNKYIDEPFDFILYSCMIALGFSAAENIVYVYHTLLGGINTAITRSIFSVPGHFLFGVIMGYYFAGGEDRCFCNKNIFKAFFMAFIIHGIYNNIIIVFNKYYIYVFIPYIIFLWKSGLKKMLYMQVNQK